MTSDGGTEGRLKEIAEQVARVTEENARLLQRLAEGERRFRLISRGVLRLQEAERGRISRELHDSVGQSLTALKMQLELLGQQATREAGGLAPRLAQLTELADRSLQEVRQLSRLLRPQMLDDLGLVPTLRWLARTTQQQAGVEVLLSLEGIDERTEPDVETLVFRVVQEALTNVAKHAHAASVDVRLVCEPGRVRLGIHDHGAGFDAARFLDGRAEDPGFGLRGMRDRVQLFGGRFQVRSSPGEGTRIDVELPGPGEAGR